MKNYNSDLIDFLEDKIPKNKKYLNEVSYEELQNLLTREKHMKDRYSKLGNILNSLTGRGEMMGPRYGYRERKFPSSSWKNLDKTSFEDRKERLLALKKLSKYYADKARAVRQNASGEFDPKTIRVYKKLKMLEIASVRGIKNILTEDIRHLTVDEIKRITTKLLHRNDINPKRVSALNQYLSARQGQNEYNNIKSATAGYINSKKRQPGGETPENITDKIRARKVLKLNPEDVKTNEDKMNEYVKKYKNPKYKTKEEITKPKILRYMEPHDDDVRKKERVRTIVQPTHNPEKVFKASNQPKAQTPVNLIRDFYGDKVADRTNRWVGTIKDIEGPDPEKGKNIINKVAVGKGEDAYNPQDKMEEYALRMHRRARALSRGDVDPVFAVSRTIAGNNTYNPVLGRGNERYTDPSKMKTHTGKLLPIHASANLLKRIILKNPNILNEMSYDNKRKVLKIILKESKIKYLIEDKKFMNTKLIKMLIQKHPEILKEISEDNKKAIMTALIQEAAWPKTKTMMSQYGMNLSGLIGWVIYRAIRSSLGECTKKCGTYEINTVRRQVCRVKCKINATERAIKEIQKSKAVNDAEKHEIKKMKTIRSLKKQLVKLHKKLSDYQTRAKKRGTEY